MELIDKTTVIAKIDNLIGNLRYTVDDEAVQIDILSEVEKFINTLEVKEVDLENYISNKLRELGADLINHKPYSFNHGLNVGKTNAYNDILDRLNARKEK